MYWPNQMNSFTSVDLATDLTEYMDDEWKAQFTDESILEIGTYDGKLYNVPYSSVYPLIIANTDVTDAAGVRCLKTEAGHGMILLPLVTRLKRKQENSVPVSMKIQLAGQ